MVEIKHGQIKVFQFAAAPEIVELLAVVVVTGVEIVFVAEQAVFAVHVDFKRPLAGYAVAAAAEAVGYRAVRADVAALGNVGVFGYGFAFAPIGHRGHFPVVAEVLFPFGEKVEFVVAGSVPIGAQIGAARQVRVAAVGVDGQAKQRRCVVFVVVHGADGEFGIVAETFVGYAV